MSLRERGKTTIALDKPTRSMLKQLAGDMPVSDYVREFALRELRSQGKGIALPGQERSVSEASLPAISSKLDTVLRYLVEGGLDKAVLGAFEAASDALVTAMNDTEAEVRVKAQLGQLFSTLKTKVDNSQLILKGLDEQRA